MRTVMARMRQSLAGRRSQAGAWERGGLGRWAMGLGVFAAVVGLALAPAGEGRGQPAKPPYEWRWFYAAYNLQVEKNADTVVALIERVDLCGGIAARQGERVKKETSENERAHEEDEHRLAIAGGIRPERFVKSGAHDASARPGF